MSLKQRVVLSLSDSNVLKGVALLLLLCHHLFSSQNGGFDDVHLYKDHYLVQDIGIACKLCVAIFVFLSGYGLSVKRQKEGAPNLKNFYVGKIGKLLLNYWFFWILFVPVGVFVFGRTLADAYGHEHVLLQFLLDVGGVIDWFGWVSYNPTWWFYSCIILLYALFPLLYQLTAWKPLVSLLLSVAISFVPVVVPGAIKFYIIAFVLGIFVAMRTVPCLRNKYLIPLLLLFVFTRPLMKYPLYVIWDAGGALLLAFVLCRMRLGNNWVRRVLEFIGKHSMNIFLFHTFIFQFWFPDIIYSTRNPFIIYLTLLAVCLPLSLLIEGMKRLIRFDVLVRKVSNSHFT